MQVSLLRVRNNEMCKDRLIIQSVESDDLSTRPLGVLLCLLFTLCISLLQDINAMLQELKFDSTNIIDHTHNQIHVKLDSL